MEEKVTLCCKGEYVDFETLSFKAQQEIASKIRNQTFLKILATHNHHSIRSAVVSNNNTPDDVIIKFLC